jgi:endonuclease-3
MKKYSSDIVQAGPDEIEEIRRLFLKHYPDSVTELNYRSLYELLVAVMLSAQCTDRRVNMITPALFECCPDIETLAETKKETVAGIIRSCSFFNNKAANLVAMAQMVKDEFHGEIPLERNQLIKLPGVGQKTANVIMIEYTGANYMAVDTHVYRVSHRLGLTNATSVKATEDDLVKNFGTDLHRLHQAMVLFGRYICKAVKPDCERCFLTAYCKSRKSFKAR